MVNSIPFPGPVTGAWCINVDVALILDRDSEALFEQSFDFSKFSNLQEVDFGLVTGWVGKDLPWISMALSTLRPTTSPRLSSLRLDFGGSYSNRFEYLIEDSGNDLQRIGSEVARIEREFEGRVNFTVARDTNFEVLFDILNVRFHSAASARSRSCVDPFPFVLCRSFSKAAVETGRLFLPLASSGWPSCDIGSFGRVCRRLAPQSVDFSTSDTSCTCGMHCGIHGQTMFHIPCTGDNNDIQWCWFWEPLAPRHVPDSGQRRRLLIL